MALAPVQRRMTALVADGRSPCTRGDGGQPVQPHPAGGIPLRHGAVPADLAGSPPYRSTPPGRLVITISGGPVRDTAPLQGIEVGGPAWPSPRTISRPPPQASSAVTFMTHDEQSGPVHHRDVKGKGMGRGRAGSRACLFLLAFSARSAFGEADWSTWPRAWNSRLAKFFFPLSFSCLAVNGNRRCGFRHGCIMVRDPETAPGLLRPGHRVAAALAPARTGR